MASTEFKVVSWAANVPFTDDMIDTMVNNDNFLFNNITQADQSKTRPATDHSPVTSTKIASGLALITSSKSRERVATISFNSYFSPKCLPIVTTDIVSNYQRTLYVTVQGFSRSLRPTAAGFHAHVFAETLSKTKSIPRNVYVSWKALGY
jgi:hypothetical protein